MPVFLIVFSCVARALFIGALPPGREDPVEKILFEALRTDLSGWLAHSPRKPPLYAFLHIPLLHLFDYETIAKLRLGQWQIALINSLGFALLAAAAQRLGAFRPIIAIYLTLYSLALMGLEIVGPAYDQSLFFCTSFLLWAAAAYVQDRRAVVWLGAAGALMALNATIAMALVGTTATVLVLIVHHGRSWPRRFAMLIVAVAPAMLVAGTLSVKNYIAVGTMAPANGAGHAVALNALNLLHWKTDAWRRFAVEAGAPAWYLWCFDNAAAPEDTSSYGVYKRSLGWCVDDTGQPPQPVWPTDFRPLEEVLTRLQATDVQEQVKQDRLDAEAGGRLFVPFGFLDTRFFAAFSRWNEKIARRVFFTMPRAWIEHVGRKHSNPWLIHGPRYPIIWLRAPFWTAGGSEAPGAGVLEVTGRWFGGLVRYTYRAIPWAIGLVFLGFVAARLFRRYAGAAQTSVAAVWPVLTILSAAEAALERTGNRSRRGFEGRMQAVMRRGDLQVLRPSPRFLAAVILFSLPPAVMASIFLGYVGTEENRFFQQTVPYLCLGGSVFFSILLRPLSLLLPDLKPDRSNPDR